ncbi:HET-domain-containing protein, partial [Delitschia confertaspora ATCC 74209]
LNRRKREIRLVELVQNPEDEMITLKFHRKTDQDEIKYTALSYTWGDATRTRQVILEGKIFEIRQNLWQFLYQARKHSWYKLLWIDAICIDQDDAEERKHQVALMGSIYSEAEQVAIWLGPAAWNSDVAVHYLSGSEKTYAKSVSTRSMGTKEGIVNAILDICERPYWRRLWIVQEVI